MVGRTGIEPAVVRLKGGFSAFADRTPKMAVQPGLEPGSFRLTAGRVTVNTTVQQSWLPRNASNVRYSVQSRVVFQLAYRAKVWWG
jgi:hypothetical protein